MKKVLVVTLSAGEAELEDSIASLQKQVGVSICQVILKDLPKQKAHQQLFSIFDTRRAEFDFMLKLDADMVLSNDSALARMLDHFDEGIDAVSLTVWDRLTHSRMWSVNLYRSSCRFDALSNDPLFTDRVPVFFNGRKLSVIDLDNLVQHAPKPHDFQAFMFGVHRAFKVIQPAMKVPRLEASYHQMKILRKVWKNYSRNDDIKAYKALLGADLVLRAAIVETEFNSKVGFESYFKGLREDAVPIYFEERLRGNAWWDIISIFGPTKFLKSCFSYVKRKGFRKVWRFIIPRGGNDRF